MLTLAQLLAISNRDHSHLCPRQILGVRIGLAGLAALGYREPPHDKSLLVILESDGCFADGVSAATGCTVGHRTLRVEDYGKVAATIVDVATAAAVRITPALDVRQRAAAWAPDEPRRYYAQMQAYQAMPDELLLTVTAVQLMTPICQLVSRPGVRVNCAICGEEIINERQVVADGLTLCRACAGESYYQTPLGLPFFAFQESTLFSSLLPGDWKSRQPLRSLPSQAVSSRRRATSQRLQRFPTARRLELNSPVQELTG